jgi:hypothetical protein
MSRPAPAPRPAAGEREALLAYLDEVCSDDADLLATARALADAGEIELLRLMRDFRDGLPGAELLQRYGPAAALDEKLRVVHRVYVDGARRVRAERERPRLARACYEARMLARRDNYQAMLDDAQSLAADVRAADEALVRCAREKVPYDELPARLGRDALAVQEQLLRLRQRFKEWAARRKGRAEGSAPGGVCDG